MTRPPSLDPPEQDAPPDQDGARAPAASPDPAPDARARALRALAATIRALPGPVLVALDVDGTLAPIVDDPDAAAIPPATAAAVRRVAGHPRFRVAVVTGRDARSLERMADLRGVHRAVEHGRRLLAPGEQATPTAHPPAAARKLEAFRVWARELAVPEGARLEEKDGAIAVHARELAQRDPDAAARVLAAAADAARRAGLHPRLGRSVVEGELAPGDKGAALAAIHGALGARGVVYAGDDLTDLPAIARAVELGGVGLFVRSPERRELPADATAALEGPDEVCALLEALADDAAV